MHWTSRVRGGVHGRRPHVYRDVRCGPKGCNGPDIVGRCTAYVVSFGCHARVVEMPYQGGFVREVHRVCLD
ncbi:MAG: hypothetical protein R3B13_11450 [Polyangiaceae bacterium]